MAVNPLEDHAAKEASVMKTAQDRNQEVAQEVDLIAQEANLTVQVDVQIAQAARSSKIVLAVMGMNANPIETEKIVDPKGTEKIVAPRERVVSAVMIARVVAGPLKQDPMHGAEVIRKASPSESTDPRRTIPREVRIPA